MPEFGEGDPTDYDVQTRGAPVDQGSMGQAATRAAGGRSFNPLQTAGYYALGSLTDLADTVASSIPGVSGGLKAAGLGGEREDFNNYVTRSLDLPGLKDFYYQNKGGIEAGSGIAAVIGSELIARRLTAPAGALMAGLRETPYLSRIAALDESYSNAMTAVRSVDQKLATRGLTGIDQYRASATIDTSVFNPTTREFVSQPVTLSRAKAVTQAKGLGALVGVRNAAVTEAVMGLTANQNGFLYDDSASYNIMLGGLGIGGAAALDWVHAGYAIRKAANSREIVKAFSDALDPEGLERSRLEWSRAGAKSNEKVDFFGGAYTDRATQLGVEAAVLKSAPLDTTDDAFALRSQRDALATQTIELQRKEIQKVTTKGLTSDGRTRFSMDSQGYGNHADMMLYRDPAAFNGIEMVGGVGTDTTAGALFANHDYRVNSDLAKTTDEITDLIGAGDLTPKQSTRLTMLQSKVRRLDYLSKFSKHVAVDGEWLPPSEASTFDDIDFSGMKVQIDRLDQDKQYWKVAADGKDRALVGSDLDIIMPGGKSVEDSDFYDALRYYRAAREATSSLARSDRTILIQKAAAWPQLDMAEEILRQSNGAAKIVWPEGMTRESAQVESFIQKSEILKGMSKTTDDSESTMSQLRVHLNLPKLSAYERGVLGTNQHPAEFLLRGMGNFTSDDLRQMSLSDLKDAVAQTKRLGDVAPASANDVKSLYGNSFQFMLDEKGQPIKPLVALMRPMHETEWSRDDLAGRLAARKMKTLQTLTGPEAAPLSRELANALFNSEDFHLASRPDQIMETHMQGSILGSSPQSWFGALKRELLPTEWNVRDSPNLLGAGRLRDLVSRITPARFRQASEAAFGDSLKLLSNPHNAPTKLLLNQFHSFRPGWDLEANAIPRATNGKTYHGFQLSDTAANRARWKVQYGEEMPDEAFLRGPAGQDVVLDDLGLGIQKSFNAITDQIADEKNTLLDSVGRGRIRKQGWFVPSPQVEGKRIGYIVGPDNGIVPGYAVVEDTADGFAKSRQAAEEAIERDKPGAVGMGYRFLTLDQIKDFSDIWDRSAMDMINPGTTAIQPGKRGAGKNVSAAVQLDSFSNGLKYLRDMYIQHGNDIVSTMLKEQINSAQSRAAIAKEVSQNRGGRYANANFRSVHDYYLESLLGRSKASSEGSIIGSTMRGVEAKADKGLEFVAGPASRAWQAVTDHLGRVSNIWDKSAQARKDFDSLTTQLGPYMPFKTASELAERRQAGVTPLTVSKLTNGLNKFSAALTLRILETGQPIMNLAGIVNAMPSVVRQFTPRVSESTADFAARVGHSAAIFNVGDKPVAIADMVKIANNSFKKAWSREADADYDFMLKRGYITQEVAEFNRQFAVLDQPGKFQSGVKKLVDKSSVLSDKSEDFSRAWGHFIGLEVADILGMEGRESRHVFAHDIANKMIANYSPQNRAEVFQGGIGSVFGLFQSFAQQYYSRMFRYIETKDLRSAATQMAVQSSLFGVTGLTGWNEASSFIHWASGGERDPSTGIHSSFTGNPGDLLAHGLISQIPKLFGQEGVDLYSRGDTAVRVPGVGTSSLPGVQVLTKIMGGIGEGLNAMWTEHATLTHTRMAEIASNMVVNRPLSGAIEQFLAHGDDTDAYGQLVSETKSWAEATYRIMGLRSERQSKDVEAFYADKRAQEQQASLKENLRLSTRAALRENRPDLMQPIFEKYLQTGGDPRYFRKWLKGNYEAATTTRSKRQLDNLLRDPQQFSRAMRFLDMGVGVDESDAQAGARENYAEPDSQVPDSAGLTLTPGENQ